MLSVVHTGTGFGLASDLWCSSQNQAVRCPNVAKGVCVPLDNPTLGRVKSIQRYLNRMRSFQKLPLLYVDGMIGPKTFAILNSALPDTGSSLGPFSFCDNAMAHIEEVETHFSGWVARAALGPVPDPVIPKSRLVPRITKTGVAMVPPPIKSKKWWWVALGAAVVVGGVVYYKRQA